MLTDSTPSKPYTRTRSADKAENIYNIDLFSIVLQLQQHILENHIINMKLLLRGLEEYALHVKQV